MLKNRLDLLLYERGLADSRSAAQALIMAGQVRVNGQVVIKPATKVEESVLITVDRGPKYVSRGGEKLEAAFTQFPFQVTGRICADVGASTGGFTDCMLQNGAEKVYAIDVGSGILHWKLRNHPQVVCMENTNARFIESLPEPVTRITVDASFISLKTLLPVLKNWFPADGGELVTLIKPQFEAGRAEVSRGKGVIQNPAIHRQVLEDVLGFAQTCQFELRGLVRSPLKGPKGNTEFLAYFLYPMQDGQISASLLDDLFQQPEPVDLPQE